MIFYNFQSISLFSFRFNYYQLLDLIGNDVLVALSLEELGLELSRYSVYALGVRDFAIFFDDIKEKDGAGQAELLRWLDEHFVAAHGDVSPLITVPTEYFLPDMREPGGATKPYTKSFAKGLPKTAVPLFTGDGVAIEGLPPETLDGAAKLYRRQLGVWWNYPVNDYMEQKLALGPVGPLPKGAELPMIFFNPMTF